MSERLPGYEILEKIHESIYSATYRGKRAENDDPVVIRYLNTRNASALELARFRQEYTQIRGLDLDGVIGVCDIVSSGEGIAIIREDDNGITLSEHLKQKGPITITAFLDWAVELASALGSLHARNRAHLAVNPHHIIVTPHLDSIRLTDFGISDIITHESDDIYNPEVATRILTYMSPEQTGRMNRDVDYRTDLYSLGLTFYEMIVGNPPFVSDDPVALIHFHIAVEPKMPRIAESKTGEIVWQIIRKLLSKDPEDRYQNAYGLLHDLRVCRDRRSSGQADAPFEIGMADKSPYFIIPQKLFGREKETALLLSGFELSMNRDRGSSVMMVTGPSGIGRTSVVMELQKPVSLRNGLFISGKCDQFKKDTPYGPIIQAFQSLMRHILSGREETVREWRKIFINVLGANIGVMTNVVPEMELIVGRQEEPESLGPVEAKNRFNYTFERFISVVSTKDHPLTLFLDDIQWMDHSSFELLFHVLSGRSAGHFYLILSLLDDESPDNQPLNDFIASLSKYENVSTSSMVIAPLSENEITGLIHGFLKCGKERASVLAGVIHRKTGGNPFFVHQFLHTLYNEKIVEFHPVDGWVWDDRAAESMEVTENILALMERKISRLPSWTLDILKIGSCIGNRFDLETLAHVSGKTLDQTLSALDPALTGGYLKLSEGRFVFMHNRIQEAVHLMIPDEDKARFHGQIGKKLLESTPEDERSTIILQIAEHLNCAKNQITDKNEKRILMEVNLEAGLKAKASVAFELAGTYFENALSLIGQEGWADDFNKTLMVHEECADIACLNGRYDRMEIYAETIRRNAPSAFDRVRMTEISVRASYILQDYACAVRKGITFLREFDYHFPEKITKRHIVTEFVKVVLALWGKSEETILSLPWMTDRRYVAISRIINSMGVAGSLYDRDFYALLILKRVLLTLKHGRNPYTGLSFTAYGGFLISVFGDVKNGIRYGELSLRFATLPEGQLFRQRIHVTYDLYIRHWKDNLIQCRDETFLSARMAREAGDQPYVGISQTFGDYLEIITCDNFTRFWNVIFERGKIIEQSRLKATIQMHCLVIQWVTNLIGKGTGTLNLSGQYFHEDAVIPEWIEKKNIAGLGYYYTVCVINAYMSHDYKGCLDYVKKARSYIKLIKAMLITQILICFDALVRLCLCRDMTGKELKNEIRTVDNILKTIRKWSEIAPVKHMPWIYLIEAEKSWVEGRDTDAMEIYDKAIDGFGLMPSAMFKVIACERAALFYKDRGRMKISAVYIGEALSVCNRTGLKPRAETIKASWADVIGGHSRQETGLPDDPNDKGVSQSRSMNLDLATIMKSSLALSSEIVLEKLLGYIIRFAIENAGAQHGFFILENKEKGGYFIEASGRADHTYETLKSVSLEGNVTLAVSIVHYVSKTGENIIIDDASNDSRFSNDPYIILNKPKSILCGPVRHQGLVSGIVYLENNLVTGAFTEDRLKLLTLLSSQAAISVENARLFATIRKREAELRELNLDLEQRVIDRTMALDFSLKKVEEANRHFLSSLRYSRVIQTALLPDRMRMKACLPDSFSIWQPRDIIGGDFYYFEELPDGFIIGVIDCTGHGVPGAFMTIIASSGLRRIINEDGETHPPLILKKLNRFVKSSLQQDSKNAHSDDGLDASICTYHYKTDTLTYSGAGLPLFIVRNGEVDIFKGDRQKIGYVDSDPDYNFSFYKMDKAHEIEGFYMMTDGFTDQLGFDGQERQRFGKKKFKDLLARHHNLPFNQQKQILMEEFNTYRKDEPQTDDMTLAGFRVRQKR